MLGIETVKVCPLVKKTMVVCAAHRLLNHPGACKNLHGHNYIITMELMKRDFDKDQGMIVDFGDIKKNLCDLVNVYFDHKTILQDTDPLVAALTPVIGEDAMLILPFPPTAENMSWFLLVNLQKYIDEELKWRGISVARIEVEETPNNTAYTVRT